MRRPFGRKVIFRISRLANPAPVPCEEHAGQATNRCVLIQKNIKTIVRKYMKTNGKVIILSVLVIALASCNTFSPKPTQTPAPTETSLPTSTNTPEPTTTPTKTPVPPTKTPSAPVLPMPSGKPSSEWEGIPVMPNAIAGEGDSKGYSFIVKASPDDVQKFYANAMAKLGWNMFASGQGTTTAILLMFMKGADLVTISIIPQPDGLIYVLLVK
jgi:hypothetical protein